MSNYEQQRPIHLKREELAERLGTTNNGVPLLEERKGRLHIQNNIKNHENEHKEPVKHISLFDEVAMIIKNKEREKYISEVEPWENATNSFTEVNLIPLVVTANPENIWDWCVGYCALAMERRADATLLTSIPGGQTVGTYYLAALTLFYSIEEVSVGRIPPIQRMTKELVELLYDASPCNRDGKAFVVEWEENDVQALIQSLPYNGYENPSITLAPHIGQNGAGQVQLQQVIPAITLDILREIGPAAFEEIQRYILGGTVDNRELYAYTTEGNVSNTALFSFSRDPNQDNPVQGFHQVVNETGINQRDYHLMALQWYNSKPTLRDGWNTKTVQKSTAPSLYRILVGAEDAAKVRKYSTHMVDISTIIYQAMAEMIVAEWNSDDDRTMESFLSSTAFDGGYLSTLTAGRFMTQVLSVVSRRFAISSALNAGTPTYNPNATLIGAGSRYLTTSVMDSQSQFMNLDESLAALSMFTTVHQLQNELLMPMLTTYGFAQTVDYYQPGGRSPLYVLHSLFPQSRNVITDYNFATPSGSDIPDVLDLDPTGSICFTMGTGPTEAASAVTSVVSVLQPYAPISSAVGSRDGFKNRHLYLTHYLVDSPDSAGFNLTPTLMIDAVLSRQKVDARELATVFMRLFPVMYGTSNRIGAFQTLLDRQNLVYVDTEYIEYRSPILVTTGHKRASTIFAPTELAARHARDTLIGDGGAFVDTFLSNGRWVDTLTGLAGGIAKVFAPELHDGIKKFVHKGASTIHKHLFESGAHPGTYAPVSHGFITEEQMYHALDNHFDPSLVNKLSGQHEITVKPSKQRKNRNGGGRSNGNRGRRNNNRGNRRARKSNNNSGKNKTGKK